MTAILNLLKQLLFSKKVIMAVSGFIVVLLAKIKLNVDPVTVAGLVTIVLGYLFGQGLSDQGKEAAKINAISAGAASSVPGATTTVAEMASSAKKTS